MGHGLSKMQLWILEQAAERQTRVDAGNFKSDENRLYYADICADYFKWDRIWEPLIDIVKDIHARHKELMGADAGDLSWPEWCDLHDRAWTQTQKEFKDCPSWNMEYRPNPGERTCLKLKLGRDAFELSAISKTEYLNVKTGISQSCQRLEAQGLVTRISGGKWTAVVITDAGRKHLP